MNVKPQHNRRNDIMRINNRLCITLAACLLATGAGMAQTTVTTPEGAQLEVADDLFYDSATLTPAQISATTGSLGDS